MDIAKPGPTNARAGGSFFCIEKKGGARLRAIWNGQDISSRTLAAPLPPELLTPESLGKMDFDTSPRLTKLDGQVLFDQLRVPPALSPFLSGPPTSLRRLAKAGADPSLLISLRSQGWKRDDRLYPCSRVWPMGFSWASWAAQSPTEALRAAAALHPTSVLAQDRPVPSGETAVSGVATDDIIVLTADTDLAASRDVLSFRRASSIYGMRRNQTKDVIGAREGLAVGCELAAQGGCWRAPAHTVWKIWSQLDALLRVGSASPRAVQSCVGNLTWLNLLRRLLFCVLHKVYRFTSVADEDKKLPLPNYVLTELLTNAFMGIFWMKPTCLKWYEVLAFTDASDTGLGIVTAPVPTHALRALSRLAALPDSQVLLDRPHEKVRSRTTRSKSWVMFLSHTTMKIVLSEPRQDSSHINVAEGMAVLRWLQRACRSGRCWQAKLTIIVDSKVVKGALDKGRSPSVFLNRVVRHIASIALTAGLWLEILYTPSEFNIGDLPSRHKKIGHGEKRSLHAAFFDRLSLIHDLGMPRQRWPSLRQLGQVIHFG